MALDRTDYVSQFEFDRAKVHVGAVRKYRKSNRDGSGAIHIWLYQAAVGRLEVLKEPAPPGGPPVVVVASLDWQRFVADHLCSWLGIGEAVAAGWPFRSMAWVPMAIMGLNEGGDRVYLQVGRYVGDAPVGTGFHSYNFDLSSLNVTLPHLRPGVREIQFEIVDPNWRDRGALMSAAHTGDPLPFSPSEVAPMAWNRGTAFLRLEGTEPHLGHLCRRYTLGGPALDDKEGIVWAHADDGYIVAVEHPVPDLPTAYESFRLEYVDSQSLTSSGWADFKAEVATRSGTPFSGDRR